MSFKTLKFGFWGSLSWTKKQLNFARIYDKDSTGSTSGIFAVKVILVLVVNHRVAFVVFNRFNLPVYAWNSRIYLEESCVSL